MASLLSSSILPYNHCFRSQAFTPIHRQFLLNHTWREDLATAARFQIRCLSAKNPSTESPDLHDFPTVSYISRWLQKKLESAILVSLMFVQFSTPLSFVGWSPWLISAAEAVLYSPDTKVPRTGELALRRAIPANVNILQRMRRNPSWLTDLKEKGSVLYASLIDGNGGLQNLLESIKDKDPDRVSVGLASSLDTVAELELLQLICFALCLSYDKDMMKIFGTSQQFHSSWAPGLSFLLPEQYLKYPRLTGRGTVEFTIKKGDGSAFSPAAGGEPRKHR
ncbi:hypothetical protein NE237_001600 [Protea cynaroides]|uniref:Uncharacterized protein n=1 Tax=Protea cynaroides TaxID=273540 RepID=A0A9Q0KUG3_9MAGN|nr:hypothetical protein NE237_001600 [Protea cynaroides]